MSGTAASLHSIQWAKLRKNCVSLSLNWPNDRSYPHKCARRTSFPSSPSSTDEDMRHADGNDCTHQVAEDLRTHHVYEDIQSRPPSMASTDQYESRALTLRAGHFICTITRGSGKAERRLHQDSALIEIRGKSIYPCQAGILPLQLLVSSRPASMVACPPSLTKDIDDKHENFDVNVNENENNDTDQHKHNGDGNFCRQARHDHGDDKSTSDDGHDPQTRIQRGPKPTNVIGSKAHSVVGLPAAEDEPIRSGPYTRLDALAGWWYALVVVDAMVMFLSSAFVLWLVNAILVFVLVTVAFVLMIVAIAAALILVGTRVMMDPSVRATAVTSTPRTTSRRRHILIGAPPPSSAVAARTDAPQGKDDKANKLECGGDNDDAEKGIICSDPVILNIATRTWASHSQIGRWRQRRGGAPAHGRTSRKFNFYLEVNSYFPNVRSNFEKFTPTFRKFAEKKLEVPNCLGKPPHRTSSDSLEEKRVVVLLADQQQVRSKGKRRAYTFVVNVRHGIGAIRLYFWRCH
ncbi:hypothetical protein BDZ89DRAFT_1199078 [Hymenopellis radicata]|nr:hypothetical protein BDZ89DRAFT_1199078 [Hymenopellis radicata]